MSNYKVTTKLSHMYECYDLYTCFVRRNLTNYALEADALRGLMSRWYADRKVSKKPLSVLELFSGNKSHHMALIRDSLPFQIGQFDMLELIEHPDSVENGVTIGNVLTHKFDHNFDVIYNPWDNLCVLLRDKASQPDAEAMRTAFLNIREHLVPKSGTFLAYLPAAEVDFMQSGVLGTHSGMIDVLPYDKVRAKHGFKEIEPLTLKFTVHGSYSYLTRCITETFKSVSLVGTSRTVQFEIQGTNQLRFWSDGEIIDMMRDAGFTKFRFFSRGEDGFISEVGAKTSEELLKIDYMMAS